MVMQNTAQVMIPASSTKVAPATCTTIVLPTGPKAHFVSYQLTNTSPVIYLGQVVSSDGRHCKFPLIVQPADGWNKVGPRGILKWVLTDGDDRNKAPVGTDDLKAAGAAILSKVTAAYGTTHVEEGPTLDLRRTVEHFFMLPAGCIEVFVGETTTNDEGILTFAGVSGNAFKLLTYHGLGVRVLRPDVLACTTINSRYLTTVRDDGMVQQTEYAEIAANLPISLKALLTASGGRVVKPRG